jgi:hypothetical protein
MTTKRSGLLILLIFHFIVQVKGQNPPAPAMPIDSNILLVDNIIQVTNHKDYFVDYCTKKITKYAELNNWTQAKTKSTLASINFESYRFTIHNSYAFYTTSQLKLLLSTLTKLSETSKYGWDFILTNGMMQNNLDLIVDGIIEGKYIKKS